MVSLEMRQTEATRIREKYPDRIPVIVEKAEKSDLPDIDTKKVDTTRKGGEGRIGGESYDWKRISIHRNIQFVEYGKCVMIGETFLVNSCLRPLCSVDRISMTTIEGVGSIKTGLSPLQKALVTHHHTQMRIMYPRHGKINTNSICCKAYGMMIAFGWLFVVSYNPIGVLR